MGAAENSVPSFRLPHSSKADLESKAGIFIKLNKTVGPYGAILFFFSAAVFFCMCCGAWWFRYDVAKPIVDGHLKRLNDQDERSDKIEEVQNSINTGLATIATQVTEQRKGLSEIVDSIKETHTLLKAQTEWHRRSTEEQRKTNALLQNGRIKVSNGPEVVAGEERPPSPMEPN